MLFSFTCILYICSAEIAALAVYIFINTRRKKNGLIGFSVANERVDLGSGSFMLDDRSFMHHLHFEIDSLNQHIRITEQALNDPSINAEDADLLRNKLIQSRDELDKLLKLQDLMTASKAPQFLNHGGVISYNAFSGRSQPIWN